ncbi:uncharacterized protein DS421_4g128850 [Arachis hypogaea]|nr:uncharacterized protein DS421_4g128850 [Arachis hypogaea]
MYKLVTIYRNGRAFEHHEIGGLKNDHNEPGGDSATNDGAMEARVVFWGEIMRVCMRLRNQEWGSRQGQGLQVTEDDTVRRQGVVAVAAISTANFDRKGCTNLQDGSTNLRR